MGTTSSSSNSGSNSSIIAQVLSTVITSVAIAIIAFVILLSSISTSSISIIWILINQLQLLFLLLLTGVFIPKDVEAVILGPEFAFNIYKYFPFENIKLYASLFRKFDFEMTKSSLETIGYKYSSTIANTKSLLAGTILVAIYGF